MRNKSTLLASSKLTLESRLNWIMGCNRSTTFDLRCLNWGVSVRSSTFPLTSFFLPVLRVQLSRWFSSLPTESSYNSPEWPDFRKIPLDLLTKSGHSTSKLSSWAFRIFSKNVFESGAGNPPESESSRSTEVGENPSTIKTVMAVIRSGKTVKVNFKAAILFVLAV